MSGNSTNFAADFLTSAASPLDPGIAIPSFQPASPFADPLRTTQPSSSLPVPELGLTPPQNPVASPSSGWFTVDNSGNISIDYLFDGGALEGELGIFSLSGLEAYTLGSNELIQEVTRRVLSQSTEGYLAISDALEGARFSSGLGWEGNFNSGAHLGIKTFTMNAGDRFGIVTVANGTFQELLQNPNGGKFQTLFSIAEWNPKGTQQFGQLTSDTGDTSVFAFEDLRLDGHSDRDYNDMVFQIRGATATAIDLSDLIDDTKDWLSTDLGQKIIAQTRSYIAPGKELPGDPTHPALPDPTIPLTKTDQGSNILLSPTQIHKSATQDVIDQVSSIDQTDIYQVKSSDLLGSELSVLSGNLSVSFLTPSGQLLGNQVLTPGTHLLQLPANLPSDVLIKIDRYGSSSSTYILKGFESQTEEPFNINLEFSGGLTAGQRAVMQAAAKSVEAMIAQGLPSAIVDGKIIDDLNIKISTANLDGLGETQARTKIDFMRYGTLLPAQSLVQFDISDIAGLEKSGNLFDVAQHEFLHALGFGNLWEAKGLVNYAGTPLAQYNGKNAVEEFQKSGGMTDTISLETEGNGSASLHWHQQLFPNEIMTADLNGLTGEPAPISAVTIASLADLGYEVNLDRATPDYQVLGSQSFNAEDLTPEQIAAFRLLAEVAFDDPDADYVDIAPILPTVDPDTVAPEIWAHAERGPNNRYYDWVPYQVKSGDTFGGLALRYMGSDSKANYEWIANRNGAKDPNWLYWDSNNPNNNWIVVPIHRPNYEWEQEQERLRREAELRQRQEEEARRRREQEEAFAREQERVRQEEEARRREAEAKQRELEEQERRLREEIERRRQEEERRLEEARLAELARQAEIARQQGKGGLDWYLATPLPEFGSVDPFETRLTGETVGNLVPDDYYRFTLSRNGRITAELRQLLADADLVLYDVRNRPIAYSMREGITDEHLIADLIPGTYMLRVNSPKGVTTDYELIVKFKHLLSRTEQGPPEGWQVGGGNNGGGVAGPLFSDPRIQRIYDTALKNFADPERAKANAQIAQLEAEKRSYQQQMQALLDQMNVEQRAKVHRALDDARHNANVWVDNIANPIKNTVDTLADGIINQANTVADGLIGAVNNIPDFNNGWVKDRKEDTRKLIRQGQDAVKTEVNNARSWLKGELGKIQDGVKSAVWHFFETIKNAYRTGAEINQIIANAANTFRSAIDGAVRGTNELVGKFKGQVLSAVDWTRNLGINVAGFSFNAYDQLVKPAVDAISGGVSSTINGIGNSLKGITDWLEPRTQKAVADVVNALFGDQTGHLWNKIHGVDAKIEATRTGLEKAISAAKQHIANIARQIEAFLSDPEERKRVLEALWKWGFKTVEDAYNFIVKKREEVRKEIEAEKEVRRKAEEEKRRKEEEKERRKAEEEKWLNDTTELTPDQEQYFKDVILGGKFNLKSQYDFLKKVSQTNLGELHSLSGLNLTDSDTLRKGFLNEDGSLFKTFGYLDILKKKLGQISLDKAHGIYGELGEVINHYPFNDPDFENRISSNSLKIVELNYPVLDGITNRYKEKYSFNFFDSLKDSANGILRAVGLGLHFSRIFLEIKFMTGKSAFISQFNDLSYREVFGSVPISQADIAEDIKGLYDATKAAYESVGDIQNAILGMKDGDFSKMFSSIPKLITLIGDIVANIPSGFVGDKAKIVGTISSEFIKATKSAEDLGNLHRLLDNLNSVKSQHITSDDVDFVYWARVYSGFSALASITKTMSSAFELFLGGKEITGSGVTKVTGYLKSVADIVDSAKGAAWALFEQWNEMELRKQNAIYSYLNEYYHSVVNTEYDVVSYVAKETASKAYSLSLNY